MEKDIYKINAEGRAPGRIASEAAVVLQGKNKAGWIPSKDNDTIVEIRGADKMRITGKKRDQYTYYHFSGYPGGLKKKKMKEVTPKFIIIHAVKSMMPNNRLLKERMKRIRFV